MVSMRDTGTQKYLPVLVSVSINPTCRSLASRKSSNGLSPAKPDRCGRRLSASSALAVASATSPARTATNAASEACSLGSGSPRNSGTRPSRYNCRRAVSARSNCRNSDTTSIAEGSTWLAASRITSARSKFPANNNNSANNTRWPRSPGAAFTPAVAAASASLSLPSLNNAPACVLTSAIFASLCEGEGQGSALDPLGPRGPRPQFIF